MVDTLPDGTDRPAPIAGDDAGTDDTDAHNTAAVDSDADGGPGATVDPDRFAVDDDPVARCAHCGRPFRRADLCALHAGEAHPEALSAREAAAYEEAREAESDALFVFHLKVVAAIVALLFVFIYTYAFVWA